MTLAVRNCNVQLLCSVQLCVMCEECVVVSEGVVGMVGSRVRMCVSSSSSSSSDASAARPPAASETAELKEMTVPVAVRSTAGQHTRLSSCQRDTALAIVRITSVLQWDTTASHETRSSADTATATAGEACPHCPHSSTHHLHSYPTTLLLCTAQQIAHTIHSCQRTCPLTVIPCSHECDRT